MLKQLSDDGPGRARAIVVAALGLGLRGAESAMLSMQNDGRIAVAVLAVLLASTASSIAGFAFSALCGALLFHLMDSHVNAVQIMLVCSIAIQLFSVAALWRSIDWRSLPVFLVGGVLGVPAGVYLLLHLPTGAYRGAIGILLIVYGGRLLLCRPTSKSLGIGRWGDACAGFLGGVTGGLAAFPGAVVTVWCGYKDWEKSRQRGVYQSFIVAVQPLALIAIYLMGPSSVAAPDLTWRTLAFVPAALLGAWFGLNIFRRLSDRQFEIAVNVLLVLSGIALIL